MKRMTLLLAACAVAAAGCSSNPFQGEHRRTATGATIGAGSGAVLGAAVSGRHDRAQGALIGAAAGGAVGGLIGHQMDRQEADLRYQMQGTGVEVQRQGDAIRMYAPEAITFDTGKAMIKSQFRPVLDQLAYNIQQYPNTIIRIEGHTDSTGSAALNQNLSEQRARSVGNYLVQHGVPYDRIETIGYGYSRPIADNTTVMGRGMNRRVEILLIPLAR